MPLGDAKVILRPAGDGEWVYSKSIKGSGGMAALLAANLEESSRFRWKGAVPEAVSYDYQLTWDSTDDPVELALYACRCGAKHCRGTMLDREPLDKKS